MIIIYGTRGIRKKDLWLGRANCSNCGNVCDFHLVSVYAYFTLFWIPLFPVMVKRYLVCDGCEGARTLSKKEYKELREKQLQLLENNEFPSEVIAQDFNPESLKIGWQIVKVIASAILAIFGCLAIVPIIPFIISVKNLIFKLKLKKKYDMLQVANFA